MRRATWIRGLVGAAIGSLAIAAVGVPVVMASPPVVNCATASLKDALASAPVGSTVRVKGTCTGQFRIDRNLTLAGAPTATLDGAGGGSTLTVFGFNAVKLSNLTITGGLAKQGGGIYFRGGGSLTLDHVRVSGNSATGGASPSVGQGGGLFVGESAFVTIRHSTFANNDVTQSGAGFQEALGGGLFVTGQLTMSDSSVTGNSAFGTSTDNAGDGDGGGLFVQGSASLIRTTISGNTAGGTGPTFGDAHGAGLFWSPNSGNVLKISHSTFANNRAHVSVAGSANVQGGAIFIFESPFGPDPVTISNSTFKGNQATAVSSAGPADVRGGGIFASGSQPYPVLTVTKTTITASLASAQGSTTASAEGGGIWIFGALTLSGSSINGNQVASHASSGNATGSGGGMLLETADTATIAASSFAGNVLRVESDFATASADGGAISAIGFRPFNLKASTISGNRLSTSAPNSSTNAFGGGISLVTKNGTPGDSITNSTIFGNSASSDNTPQPDVAGGGIYVENKRLTLVFDSIAHNSASASGTSGFQGAGGLYDESGTKTRAIGVVLALNTASTGPDCVGELKSGGFNLLSTTAGCLFTPVVTDQISTTPKLGPLAANGGPTKTVALLPGSPALDRVAIAFCHTLAAVDQRGIVRPQGAGCDEGAFERKP
jgi:hypothetical protein